MADLRGRFLFEISPDLFPCGFLSDLEMNLWGRFFEDRELNRKQG